MKKPKQLEMMDRNPQNPTQNQNRLASMFTCSAGLVLFHSKLKFC